MVKMDTSKSAIRFLAWASSRESCPLDTFFLAWPNSVARHLVAKLSELIDSAALVIDGDILINIRHFDSPPIQNPYRKQRRTRFRAEDCVSLSNSLTEGVCQ